MSKRYYEHEDRYSGKKFYSDDPHDPQGKGNLIDYEPAPIAMTITATIALIICPLALRIAHGLCFFDGFSWGGLIFYLILLAILYVGIGLLGACLFAEHFEDSGNATTAIIIAYIISLVVWLVIFPLIDFDFLVDYVKWYDHVLSAAFALTLIIYRNC